MRLPSALRPDSRDWLPGLVVGLAAALCLFAMAFRLLAHNPLYDELLHILSARGLRELGYPAIAGGEYNRALLFTSLVSVSFSVFDDTLAAARIPALVPSLALVVLVAVWVTRRAGLLPACVAAALLVVLPETTELAVFARFYTLHAFLVIAMSIAVYEAAAPARSVRARAALGVLAVVCLALAMHLQVTTVIAVGAMGAAVAVVLAMDHWPAVSGFILRHPFAVGASAALALAGGAFAILELGLWETFNQSPLWAAWAADRPHYYLVVLADELPFVWPLFPLAALAGLAAAPAQRRLAVFCLVAFAAAFVIHSAAAAKASRYIYYALPWALILYGCAFASVSRMLERLGVGLPAAASTRAAALLAVALTALALSGEGQDAARRLLGRGIAQMLVQFADEPDWQPAVAAIEPLVGSADRVVTSNAMKTLYHFGRYDYELNVTIVIETESGDEFGRDPRTGSVAIGSRESIARVLDMPGTTVVILEEEKLGNIYGVPAGAVEEIESRCGRHAMPDSAALRVWTCPAAAVPAESG